MRGNIHIFLFVIALFLSVDTASLNNVIQKDVPITFDIDVDKKTYLYRFETPDGTNKHEKGHFETDPSTGDESLVAEGGYSYTGDDGLLYIVTYTADKNGYHPHVSFGTRFGGYDKAAPPAEITPPPEEEVIGIIFAGQTGQGEPAGTPPPKKGIDPSLLCSLAGSGCK